MDNAIDQALQEALMRTEVTLGECLAKDCEAGKLTEAQLEFALDLLSRVNDYDDEEWLIQWDAWFTWAKESGWGK